MLIVVTDVLVWKGKATLKKDNHVGRKAGAEPCDQCPTYDMPRLLPLLVLASSSSYLKLRKSWLQRCHATSGSFEELEKGEKGLGAGKTGRTWVAASTNFKRVEACSYGLADGDDMMMSNWNGTILGPPHVKRHHSTIGSC